jgi:predicted ribosomally synthesized peptide with nif11-like leader
MAVQTAEKFLERLQEESSLKSQLYVTRPRNTDQLLQFAQGKGFIFSAEDLQAALKKHPVSFLKV